MQLYGVEIIGHISLIVLFSGVLVHVIFNRGRLKRNLRASKVFFWSTIFVSASFAVLNVIQLALIITRQMSGSLASFMDLLGEYPVIIAQAFIIGFLVMNKIIVEKASRSLRILVVGAHPDDIEIAAGATLAKLHDSGHIIHGLIMTSGEQGGDVRLRPGEARKGAGFLGLDELEVFDFCDTRLSEDEVNLVKTIENHIGQFKPDLILTHSMRDIHQDHQAVHEATLRAGRNHAAILCFESPSVTQEFVPTLFVNVADYVSVKIEAIHLHWDQRDKPYMTPDQVRGRLAFRGGQARMEYAEGFEVVRFSFETLGVC